ncbi:MAG: hypothetical protein JW956_08475 [Calditrichaceae bacterium]|nr:hypothetical protein [Calditrichaceae bacterium]
MNSFTKYPLILLIYIISALFVLGFIVNFLSNDDTHTLMYMLLYFDVASITLLIMLRQDLSVYKIFKDCDKVYINPQGISKSDIESLYSVIPLEMIAKNKETAEIVIEIAVGKRGFTHTDRKYLDAYSYTESSITEFSAYLDFIYMKTSKRIKRIKIRYFAECSPLEKIKYLLKNSFKAEKFRHFLFPPDRRKHMI